MQDPDDESNLKMCAWPSCLQNSNAFAIPKEKIKPSSAAVKRQKTLNKRLSRLEIGLQLELM